MSGPVGDFTKYISNMVSGPTGSAEPVESETPAVGGRRMHGGDLGPEAQALESQREMFEQANISAAEYNKNQQDTGDNGGVIPNNYGNSNMSPPEENMRRRRGGRRSSRKNRKNSRKDRKNRKSRRGMYGGGDPSSLPQGRAFEEITRNLHGGRRMRGGSMPMAFPFDDSTLLQGSARSDAGVGQQDQFYRESQSAIPSNMRYPQAGGGHALAPAAIGQADMLLPRGLSENALNPQWHTEVNTNPEIGRMAQAEANFRSTNSAPGFAGPVNAYQTQAGGRRRSRKQRRASRKNRKNRRNSRRH